MRNVTLHTENESDTNKVSDSVITRQVKSSSGGVWIVDIREVDSAQELKSGGVEILFENGDTKTVKNAELVGVF